MTEALVERQDAGIVDTRIPWPVAVLENCVGTVHTRVEGQIGLPHAKYVVDGLVVVVQGNNKVRTELALHTEIEAARIGRVEARIHRDWEHSGLEDVVGKRAERPPEKVARRLRDGGTSLVHKFLRCQPGELLDVVQVDHRVAGDWRMAWGSRDLSIRLDLVEAQSKKRWGNRGNTEKQPRIRERLSNTNVRAPESGDVAGET